MTARNENDKVELTGTAMPEGKASPIDSPAAAPARRRLVLRGAAAAVPAILTLHSGSAVAARSSFLISKADGAPVNEQGKHMCMDLRGSQEVAPNVYDMGDQPAPQITTIDSRAEYYKDANGSQRAYTQEVCETGDVFYKKTAGDPGKALAEGANPGKSGMVRQSKAVESGWVPEASDKAFQQVQVQGRGMLVSATALRSFANHIVVRDI